MVVNEGSHKWQSTSRVYMLYLSEFSVVMAERSAFTIIHDWTDSNACVFTDGLTCDTEEEESKRLALWS